MILSFLPQATGPVDRKAGAWGPQQPHIVRLSYALYSGDQEFCSSSWLIRPEGWVIMPKAAQRLGIDTAQAESMGRSLRAELQAFLDATNSATTFVAPDVHEAVVAIECALTRIGRPPAWVRKGVKLVSLKDVLPVVAGAVVPDETNPIEAVRSAARHILGDVGIIQSALDEVRLNHLLYRRLNLMGVAH
jgi:hypothetical protein